MIIFKLGFIILNMLITEMRIHVDDDVVFQVIKKVMKMDAAGPFNAPVNPVALGIPVSIMSC